jgi:hypothetical protein
MDCCCQCAQAVNNAGGFNNVISGVGQGVGGILSGVGGAFGGVIGGGIAGLGTGALGQGFANVISNMLGNRNNIVNDGTKKKE